LSWRRAVDKRAGDFAMLSLAANRRLAVAWTARARPDSARPALAGAWGIASGMGYYSFAGHVLEAGQRDVSGLPGWTLAAAVGAGWLLALYALASAVLARR
jgi:hypothetical protein